MTLDNLSATLPSTLLIRMVAPVIGLLLVLPTALQAQVVQLPTFQQFHVSTTVSVPDRGGTHLGGVNRLREGSTSRGIPGLAQIPGLGRLARNRGIGREASASNASVHAHIIDLQEMDRAVLAAAAAKGVPLDPRQLATARKASFLSRHVARRSDLPIAQPAKQPTQPPSVEEIKRQNALALQRRYDEAKSYFQRAQTAEREGKLAMAKVYYQMSARRTDGQVRDKIQVFVDRLSPAKKTAPATSLADGARR